MNLLTDDELIKIADEQEEAVEQLNIYQSEMIVTAGLMQGLRDRMEEIERTLKLHHKADVKVKKQKRKKNPKN